MGKRLVAHNHKKRELKAQSGEKSGVSQSYGIGAVLAVGVIGGTLVITFTNPRKEKLALYFIINVLSNHTLRLTSSKWIKSILYYKMDKKSIVKDLYRALLISVFAVGYSMLDKKILCMAPPSIQKFDLEDTGKLVAIVAASEMTREYLIKQKISPDHINI